MLSLEVVLYFIFDLSFLLKDLDFFLTKGSVIYFQHLNAAAHLALFPASGYYPNRHPMKGQKLNVFPSPEQAWCW